MIVLAFIPVFYAIFYICVPLANSCLLAGNPGAFVVSPRTDYLADFLVEIESIGWFLIVAWLIYKAGWLKNNLAAEKEGLPAISAKGNRRSRLWMLLAVTLLGLLLEYIISAQSFVDMTRGLSAGMVRIRQDNLVDAYWIGDLLLAALFSPIAQEILFRRTLYRYMRQVADPGFSLVFSALIFAGIHLRPERFFELFWTGVLYAALYEVTQSLIPCTINHCIHNLLYYIGRVT